MPAAPRLLVIGRDGQLARSLAERCTARGIAVLALGRPEFDLATFTDLPEEARAFAPTIIVNAAAHTAVDKAETEAEPAFAVNAEGAGRLADAAARLDLPIVHLSTDYVFDGTKPAAYVESDPTNPLGVYGRSKLDGEAQVAAAAPKHVILRTAWVHSPFGGNFVKTMLRLARERDTLAVVADQRGCPTYAPDLADAIIAIAERIVATGWRDAYRGVFHVAGTGETTWHGLASTIFALSAELGGPIAEVRPITTEEYPTPARRPANSRLDCDKLQRVFGVSLPAWQDSLRLCVERLLAEKPTGD